MLYWRISKELGYSHPDFWLGELTSRQVAEWEAYYRIEPFGEYYEFWRNGLLCSIVANLMRGKNQKAFTIEDFIPNCFKVGKSTQSVAQMKEVLKAAFGKPGGRKRDIKRKRKRKGR